MPNVGRIAPRSLHQALGTFTDEAGSGWTAEEAQSDNDFRPQEGETLYEYYAVYGIVLTYRNGAC